ncbi:MAG: beta-glucuronidase [Clostridia bacterium]|nr:beta-glucuronidase [Clostridia bacterium]
MKRLFDEHKIRRVTELSGAWHFSIDADDIGEQNGWQNGLPTAKSVIVPSVWNNEIGLLNYEGAAWYEKRFYTSGGTLRFVFESVMTEAKVWLDGNKLGGHYGAFSQFDFIVPNVKEGEHILVVKADSRFDKKSIPQKKVDWFNYGGIARDVSLEALSGISVLSDHIKYTLSDDMEKAFVSAELELYCASSEKTTSNISVTVGEKSIYEGSITLEANERAVLSTPTFELDNILLWSTEEPNLYTVSIKTSTDDLIDKIGFRQIEVKNNKILLNKKPIELRGVNRHDEHPDWGFAFPPKMMKRDIDIILDLGCNTVRGAHYPNSHIFLDMLDERGLLFWSEIPIWGGGFPDDVLEDPDVVERGLEMHREMAKYYYNHPSIIIWGIHNEIYTLYPCTYGISKKYSEFLRENGGNRLITHAAAFPFDDDSLEFDDIICINMYKGWYGGDLGEWDKFVSDFDKHRKKIGQDNKPVIISEFGAGALAGFHSYFDTLRWSEEYQADLLKYCLELFHKTDYIHGFYIWQFCNIRTSPELELNRVRCFNNKGILDEYRNPKNAYFTVKNLYERFASEEK